MRPDGIAYPRYFCGVGGWKGSNDILCMTGDRAGDLVNVVTTQRFRANWAQEFGIETCNRHVASRSWVEGSEYGPFDSDLSWVEYLAVQRVVRRLNGATNAA